MVLRETVRRAFTSFLAVPTALIVVFVLLALITYWVDQGKSPG